MAEILIDQSRWPVVLFTVPEVLTPTDIDRHFSRLREEVFPHGTYASIMDARRTDPLRFSAQLRQHAGLRYREHSADFARLLVSETYVLDSTLQRGVLTAIRWVAPAPWTTSTHDSLEDALAWSVAQTTAAASRSADARPTP